MLNHPTQDLMHSLGFEGLAKGFKELQNDPGSQVTCPRLSSTHNVSAGGGLPSRPPWLRYAPPDRPRQQGRRPTRTALDG